jgi:hypothetical protein
MDVARVSNGWPLRQRATCCVWQAGARVDGAKAMDGRDVSSTAQHPLRLFSIFRAARTESHARGLSRWCQACRGGDAVALVWWRGGAPGRCVGTGPGAQPDRWGSWGTRVSRLSLAARNATPWTTRAAYNASWGDDSFHDGVCGRTRSLAARKMDAEPGARHDEMAVRRGGRNGG